MAKQVFLITLVVLSTMLAGVVSGLSCYTCNSHRDTNHTACMDPMNKDVKVNVCREDQVCLRVSYIAQNIFLTARACITGLVDSCVYAYTYLVDKYPDLKSYDCYACVDDYCNSANGTEIQRKLTKEEIDTYLRKENPVKPFDLSP